MLNKDGKFIIGTDFDSGAARRYGHKFRLLNDPTYRLFSSDSMHDVYAIADLQLKCWYPSLKQNGLQKKIY